MCRRRSQGVPLQYILGDQPFGDLEILCQRGVLIPRFVSFALFRVTPLTLLIRSDTESFTCQAAKEVHQITLEGSDHRDSLHERKPLRILDACTGTGCIALLLHQLLAPQYENLMIHGVDISPIALNLAQRNLEHNLRQGLLSDRALTQVQFRRADVLAQGPDSVPTIQEALPEYFPTPGDNDEPNLQIEIDLLISNPPYISTKDFRNGTTSRSVRRFEPHLALVPPTTSASTLPAMFNAEDVFYYHIISLSINSLIKMAVFECGDIMQARRVADMHQVMAANSSHQYSVEIWPTSEEDVEANGFHPRDGSRCVIIRRRPQHIQ